MINKSDSPIRNSPRFLFSVMVSVISMFLVCLYYFDISDGNLRRSYRLFRTDQVDAVVEDAVGLHDASKCGQIRISILGRVSAIGPDEQYLKDLCYATYATTAIDPAACARIIAFDSGRNGCYTDLAERTDNPVLCEKINYSPLMAGYCMAKRAVVRNDHTLCDRLREPLAQETCRTWLGSMSR